MWIPPVFPPLVMVLTNFSFSGVAMVVFIMVPLTLNFPPRVEREAEL